MIDVNFSNIFSSHCSKKSHGLSTCQFSCKKRLILINKLDKISIYIWNKYFRSKLVLIYFIRFSKRKYNFFHNISFIFIYDLILPSIKVYFILLKCATEIGNAELWCYFSLDIFQLNSFRISIYPFITTKDIFNKLENHMMIMHWKENESLCR